jgi:uncharacterized alkaline shock family protein YloU
VVEQELGTLEVTDQVFCDIATRALSEIKGVAVVGKAPSGLFRLGSGPPITVERGQAEVAFSMHLTVRYHVCIPDMMRELHERLSRDIRQATGYTLRHVSVTIDHILPPVPKSPEPAAPAADQLPAPPPLPATGRANAKNANNPSP